MLVTHWSKNALLRNLYMGESKRAGGVRNPATTLPAVSHVSILLRVSRECIYFWFTQTTQRVTVIEVRLFNQIVRGHVTIKIIISACRLETFEGFLVFKIIPTILLLDFSADNLLFGHTSSSAQDRGSAP